MDRRRRVAAERVGLVALLHGELDVLGRQLAEALVELHALPQAELVGRLAQLAQLLGAQHERPDCRAPAPKDEVVGTELRDVDVPDNALVAGNDLDGRLRVWTPIGGGTRVRAEIPCA